jgi:hypothetical protein
MWHIGSDIANEKPKFGAKYFLCKLQNFILLISHSKFFYLLAFWLGRRERFFNTKLKRIVCILIEELWAC